MTQNQSMHRSKRILNKLITFAIVFVCMLLIAGFVSDRSYASDLSLDVSYGTIKCGQATEFTLNASGGDGEYLYLFNSAYLLSNDNKYYLFDSSYSRNLKYNPSTHNNSGYQDENTFNFTFYASGEYQLTFYVMSNESPGSTKKATARKTVTININDNSYPAVEAKADAVAAQCLESGAETDYEKALWLHDWLLDNCKYDYKYLYCSAEGALCRGTGTCEAYHRAYEMLLDRVGVAHGRIEGNGHVWTAVRMDGEWYQIDVTWDDTGGSSDDNKHMYFGLTDELTSKVHSDHRTNTGYESNSLDCNYFVMTGRARSWYSDYIEDITSKIAGGKKNFEIAINDKSSENYDKTIQYTAAAYAMTKDDTLGLGENQHLEVSYMQEAGNRWYACTLVDESPKVLIKGLKLKPGIKKLRLKWTKLRGSKLKLVDRIQIEYSSNPDMSNSRIITISKRSRSKLIKGLNKRAYYYVRMRTYRRSGGERQYSGWTAIRRIKTK